MALRRVIAAPDPIYEALFDPIIQNVDTRSFQYQRMFDQKQFLGRQPTTANQEVFFEMTDQNRYFLPAQSYLYIQAQVLNNGGALANTATTALQNNFPLLTNLQYAINGVNIETQASFFQVTHLMRNLMDYSNDNGHSFQDECWVRDAGTTGGTDARPSLVTLTAPGTTGDTAISSVNPAFNPGYYQRWQTVTTPGVGGSKVFTLRIPLWRLFCFLTKDVVYVGARHAFSFNINPNLNQLFIQQNGDNTVPQLSVKNIFWECPYVDPSSTTRALLMEKMLALKESRFMYQYSQTYQYVIGTAQSSVQWPIATITERPTMVAVAVQSQARSLNANLQQNVAIFDTQDISNIYLTYGGRDYPQYQYKPSNAVGFGPGEAYATYLQLTNRYFDVEGGASISFADFQNLYNIILFDLRYTDDDTSPFAAGQSSQLNLNLTFNGAGPASSYVWATVFSERELITTFADGKTLVSTK
jgi:hypothetical protein